MRHRFPLLLAFVYGVILSLSQCASSEQKTKSKILIQEPFEIFIQILKEEAILELWLKKDSQKQFQKMATYPICYTSGTLGPKNKQGDRQVPEGIYFNDRFNPKSKYHLSLGINYPNHADRSRSSFKNLGGDIFIHGKCVSIGCIPILDSPIEELFDLASQAKSFGQENIPVYIFPFKMTIKNLKSFSEEYWEHEKLSHEIAPFYRYFEQHRTLPQWNFLANSYHIKN